MSVQGELYLDSSNSGGPLVFCSSWLLSVFTSRCIVCGTGGEFLRRRCWGGSALRPASVRCICGRNAHMGLDILGVPHVRAEWAPAQTLGATARLHDCRSIVAGKHFGCSGVLSEGFGERFAFDSHRGVNPYRRTSVW